MNKLIAFVFWAMVACGGLWLVAEFTPMPAPKGVVMTPGELGEVSDLMQEALDELKRRQNNG